MLPIAALNTICAAGRPASIESIGFSPSLRLLVLAPHPDDFDAIAITLQYFQTRGNETHPAVLSGGSRGVQNNYADPPTRKQKARLREQEQMDSCRFFGLPPDRLCFLRLPDAEDGELAGNTATRRVCASRSVKPHRTCCCCPMVTTATAAIDAPATWPAPQREVLANHCSRSITKIPRASASERTSAADSMKSARTGNAPCSAFTTASSHAISRFAATASMTAF